MEQQYGDDFITIVDEEGNSFELEVLSELEYEGNTYVAVVAAPEDEQQSDEDLEVSILKASFEDGERYFDTVEDEEELEAVYNLFLEQSYEEEDEQSEE
ncbi:MAG: DUF1292 domain-containing protein [Oscillospiraceae bacterium]|nr:DUF1292 domain-containing protein [Oscillospiraceae bacterium]